MADAVIVEGAGKLYRRYTGRPPRFADAFVRGWWRRLPRQRLRALTDVSFRLTSGRTLGVIGRNGAGKSTLLNLVGGISRPTEGRVETHGRLGALLDLGSSFHHDLTGRENVFLGGVVAGLTRSEVEDRFASIVEFAELEPFIDSPVRTYSTGMRMRLAFSVAVHTDPEILLVDEVLAVGDQGFQYQCLERIADLKSRGCAILLVSHDTATVEQLCDEVLWLRAGRVEAHGATKAVVERYLDDLMMETRKRMADHRPPKLLTGGHELRLNENRFGSLELEIFAVQLFGAEGGPIDEIEPGAAVTVQIDYRASRPIPGAQAGVTISRADGVICCDVTTAADGHVLPPISGGGRVGLTLDRLDLAAGQYYVDVALYERDWAYAYDLHWHVYPLRVSGPPALKGMLSPPHRWVFESETNPSRPAATSRS